MMIRKIPYLIFCFLLIPLIYAADTVTDTLEVGQTKSYSLDGVTYEVTIMIVSGDSSQNALTKLIVNGEVSPNLRAGEDYSLNDHTRLTIVAVRPTKSGDVVQNLVEFSIISTPCGDGVCSENEHCAADNCCEGQYLDLDSDHDNCGQCGFYCDDYETCTNRACRPVCGDDYCSSDETCEVDNCCDGNEEDLLTDEENCGVCGLECEETQLCKDGVCEGFCGNDICDAGETCKEDNCCGGEDVVFASDEDNCGACGIQCFKDEKCSNRLCVTYCGNGVCEPNEKCDEDCYVPPIEEPCSGCLLDDECLPLGSIKDGRFCDGDYWIVKKNNGESCSLDYECVIDSCIEGVCQKEVVVEIEPEKAPTSPEPKSEPVIIEKSFIERILNWFRNLF